MTAHVHLFDRKLTDDFVLKMMVGLCLKLLQEQGVCMRTTAEDEIVREMKERCCYVAPNYEAESSCRGMQYTMPDGQVITLETERFR